MKTFSPLMPLTISEEEIGVRIKANRLSLTQKELFKVLVIGSYGVGAQVRDYQRSDSHASGVLYRSCFEKGVSNLVSGSELTPSQKELAYDAASFSYQEGHRLQGQEPLPPSVNRILSEL